MDESGCLGFDFSKQKTSKTFIICFLFINNKRSLEKIVSKVFQSMSPKDKKGHSGALHANKEKPRIIIKALQELRNNKSASLMLVRLNKRKVYTNLQNEKPVLYNYVTNILLGRIFTKKLTDIKNDVTLVASQRETNKFLNDQFKSYLKNQNNSNHKANINIEIKSPRAEKGLQIVDLVCWACFKKYEYQDDTYYNLIKNLIVEDSNLYGQH